MHAVLPETAPKYPESPDRSVPLDYVLSRIPALRKRFGITRIADITRLDRIDWPTVAAIVPSSPDNLGSYCGKGRSREAALVSAIMEAVERQVCARWEAPRVLAVPARELGRTMRLREAGFVGSWDDLVPCVDAVSIVSRRQTLVPYELVRCPWPYARQFKIVSTNGLASGATLAEAFHHAAFEIFERHAFALAEVHASLFPRIAARAGGVGSADRDVWDSDQPYGSEIVFPTGHAECDAVHSAIIMAGRHVRVVYVDQPSAIPIACATIWTGEGESIAHHSGMGCSLDPWLAVLRALTEAVQSRLVDRSSIREDMSRAGDPDPGFGGHVRRDPKPPSRRWWFDIPLPKCDPATIVNRSTRDLMEDVATCFALLGPKDIADSSFLSLTAGEDEIAVVRIVAPGLRSEPGDLIQRFLRPFGYAHASPILEIEGSNG